MTYPNFPRARIVSPTRDRRPKRRAAWGSSGDDNAANQDIIRIRDFFAATFHVLDAEVDGFADVGESLRNRFALRIVAGKRGAHNHVAAVVVVGLQETLKSRVVICFILAEGPVGRKSEALLHC